MIGRLTRFELKKTLGGKFFLTALCLMLLLNLLLNCGIREWYEVQDLVRQESSMVDNLSNQQKNNFFALMKSARVVAGVCKQNWKQYAQLTPEDKTALAETLKERYGENVLDRDFFVPTDEMINTTGTLEGSDENDLGLIMNLQVVEGRNQDEEENRQRVLKSAKRLGQDAVKKGDSYNIRRNLRVLKLYAEPRQPSTAPTIRGWSDFLFGSSTMLLVYLMVLLACAGSFSNERESQALFLLHTAKNGKTKTLLAKYLSGAVTAAGLVLLFQAVTVGAIAFKTGIFGASEPIYILDGMDYCPFRLTIGQYACLTMLGWMLCAVILSVILNTISALSKNSVISYGVGAVALGGSIALAYAKPRIEWFSGPLAFTWNNRFFESYYSVNLFTFPLWWGLTLVIFWAIVGILCIVLADRVFHRKRRAL